MTQTKEQNQAPKVFEEISTEAQVGDYFRLPFKPIVRVVEIIRFPERVVYTVLNKTDIEEWEIGLETTVDKEDLGKQEETELEFGFDVCNIFSSETDRGSGRQTHYVTHNVFCGAEQIGTAIQTLIMTWTEEGDDNLPVLKLTSTEEYWTIGNGINYRSREEAAIALWKWLKEPLILSK